MHLFLEKKWIISSRAAASSVKLNENFAHFSELFLPPQSGLKMGCFISLHCYFGEHNAALASER